MLAVEDGTFQEGRREPLHWREAEDSTDEQGKTRVWSFFEGAAVTPQDVEAEKSKQAKLLVSRINRLIRWYRVVSSDRSATELTLWKVSPFYFSEGGAPAGNWSEPLAIASPEAVGGAFYRFSSQFEEMSQRIKSGFESGGEPPVASLFLLDARQALDEGRFREAVLFSWSTIDATFNICFGRLVDQKLAADWKEGMEFIKGIDFPLRSKMTVGLRLLAGKSLYDVPEKLFVRLSESYRCRNRIIHEGQMASEDDARESVAVAERLVPIMAEIAREHGIGMSI